jgi:hypothetical protein
MFIRNNFWSSLRDYFLLCGLLAAANWFLAGEDLGWLKLNPTPWLLPAVLLGARYGFATGLGGGISTAGLIALVQWKLSHHVEIQDVLEKHSYVLLSIVTAGAAAGELRALIRRFTVQTNLANQSLAAENSRLRCQLELVRETRQQLQEQLSLFNAPLMALDEELLKLFECRPDAMPMELLRCLHRLTGVTSAGIYFSRGDNLEQSAVLHPTPPLVSRLILSHTPLAKMALTTNKLASVPDAAELNAEQPFLAALPWLDEEGRTAVLLIQDLPLESFTMQNLARVELMLKWVSALTVFKKSFSASAESDHTVTVDIFRMLLHEAVMAAREHGVPSTVLRFETGTPKAAATVLKMLPATAAALRVNEADKLVVLLPFSGEAEAEDLSRRLMAASSGLSIERYLIAESVTGDELWKHLSRA